MRGNWWVILLLLLGVWQVVGSLIEKAGKKQQAQRLKDIAAQRGHQTGEQGRSQPAPRTTPRAAPAPDRAEALAARRREQLEQLRQRRAGQKPGAQPPTTARPTARPTPAAASQPGQRQISLLQPGRVQTTQQPATVIRRAGTQPRTAPPTSSPPRRTTVRPTPERAVTPQPAPAQQQEPAPIEGESSTRRVVKDVVVAPEDPRTRHLPVPFVPGEPLGPHLLRQMVLFREILEPPVSIRDRPVWERG
ncbi:MAG: hypothetical protein ACYTGF_03380 [Planctomycetota bacterium]|jgi:hypothetical protein